MNNAGIMATPLDRTYDGYEIQVSTCETYIILSLTLCGSLEPITWDMRSVELILIILHLVATPQESAASSKNSTVLKLIVAEASLNTSLHCCRS